MEQIEFPYQDCQPMKKITDAQLMEKLKIENCHFDLDICGTAEETFLVSTPGSNEAFRYTVYLSDECIIAPMALFHPELLEICRAPKVNGVKYMGKNQGDAEDPHDNIYLSETSRKYTKVNYPKSSIFKYRFFFSNFFPRFLKKFLYHNFIFLSPF